MLNFTNIKFNWLYIFSFIIVVIFSSCSDLSTANKPESCNNQCRETGIFCDKEVDDTVVFNCRQDDNGCFIREIFETCKNKEVCIAGECQIKECESQCNIEGYFCDGDQRYECGNFDNDICLEKREVPCSEGYTCVMGKCEKACEEITYYRDNDNDGFGAINNSIEACSKPEGYVENSDDCNDNNKEINPNANEICDNEDNNCNTVTDEGCGCIKGQTKICGYSDVGECKKGEQTCDINGNWGECVGAILPTEEICDDKDNDCDGEIDEGVKITYYIDDDNDGFGNTDDTVYACSKPEGYVENNRDCDDSDNNINPNASEKCDGKDNDCDGIVDEANAINCNTYYLDLDDDNYGDNQNSKCLCNSDEQYKATVGGDCNDNNSDINPGAEEVCDRIDNDCDALIDESGADGCTDYYLDMDDDGHGKTNDYKCLCEPQAPYTTSVGDDCDDDNSNVNPSAEEICDFLDNNCNGEIDEGFDNTTDTDEDGIVDCIDNCPYTVNANQLDTDSDNMGDVCDCYQDNADISIQEVCNGVDDNCNGEIDEGDVCATDDCTVEIYDNHKYIFCNSDNVMKSWNEARKYCNERNYNLVTIEDEDENNWILSKIQDDYWIGLYEFKGDYRWESGKIRIWNTDNDDSDEECWEIQNGDSEWHDRYCSDDVKRKFICEQNYNTNTIKTLKKSCKEILDTSPQTLRSGFYYINIGTDDDIKPQLVYCDMITDGGGWTLVASWFYDYKWTLSSYSSSKVFGIATKDTVSSNFGNMLINDFRVVASENIFDNGLSTINGLSSITRKAKADWYYHYNTAITWKEVWAPQAHNDNNENDCSNGYISNKNATDNTSRQSIKRFNYSKNIKFNYTNSNHHWNNISDWSTIYDNNIRRPKTCDRIADYWGALTQEGIEFTVYNNSNNEHDPVEDGVLGIPIKGNDTSATGHDIKTFYNARVGYDDGNKNACYGSNKYDWPIYDDNDEDIDDETKLWWFVR